MIRVGSVCSCINMSLYLLCKHNQLQGGRYCDDCLEEKRLDSALSERVGALQLCSHYYPVRTCSLCADIFLAFAMCTHERLGSIVAAPEILFSQKREIVRGDEVFSTVVTVKNRHNSFQGMTADILRLIWKYYSCQVGA